MELPAILERIERRLKALKVKPGPASEAAGRRDAIRNISRALEEGRPYSPTLATIDDLAPVLETTPEWLLFEIGEESPLSVRGTSEIAARSRARQNNSKINMEYIAKLLEGRPETQLALIATVIEALPKPQE